MYSIHSCPGGQPLTEVSVRSAPDVSFVLHLRENRSQLSQEARVTFTVLIGLFMAMAILPAMSGEMLVPVFSLGTMALLVGALEWHQASRPASEWLVIEDDRLHWDGTGQASVNLPIGPTRLVEDRAAPASLRLFLQCPWQRIEIGRCLSLDERREIAPIIAHRLGETRP
ncbi:MAG: DUF2244 domain-containing protein [Pseudomonadota bacterium]